MQCAILTLTKFRYFTLNFLFIRQTIVSVICNVHINIQVHTICIYTIIFLPPLFSTRGSRNSTSKKKYFHKLRNVNVIEIVTLVDLRTTIIGYSCGKRTTKYFNYIFYIVKLFIFIQNDLCSYRYNINYTYWSHVETGKFQIKVDWTFAAPLREKKNTYDGVRRMHV